MRQYQVPDTSGIEAVAPHVLDDSGGPHSGADVDQRQLSPAINQIDVAVVGIGEVETIAARTDQVDTLGQPHCLSKA